MNFHFSLAHLTVINLPPAQMIRVAANCGYSHVGLRLIAVSDTSPGYPLMNEPRQMRETLAAMADTGMAVRDIEFVKITSELDVSGLQPFFEAGAKLGASHIITSPYDTNLPRLRDKLAEMSRIGAQFGLSPVMEFFPWTAPINHLTAAIELVESTGDEGVGVLVDTLHFNRTDSSLNVLASLPASRIPFVHVCDAPVQPRYTDAELLHAARVERLPPGQGGINIRRILKSIPHETPIALEIPMSLLAKKRGAEYVARHVLSVTKEYLNDT